jgi:hypothetical protein
MIETLIYLLIGFIIFRTIIAVLQQFAADEPVDEDTKDIREHLQRQKHVTVVKVRMEEHSGWWYGYYHTKEGGELFVAQGTTYDEAVENCRQRLQEGTILKSAQLVFNK